MTSRCISHHFGETTGDRPRPIAGAYRSIQGWCDHTEAAALQELARGNIVLEIGTWNGRSAIAMAETADHVIAMDHFYGDDHAGRGNPGSQCWEHLVVTESRDRVTMMTGDWRRLVSLLDLEQFGFIYYDADHTYGATKDFIDRVVSVTACPVAFHDYDNNPNHAGVKRAIEESMIISRVVSRLAVARN